MSICLRLHIVNAVIILLIILFISKCKTGVQRTANCARCILQLFFGVVSEPELNVLTFMSNIMLDESQGPTPF